MTTSSSYQFFLTHVFSTMQSTHNTPLDNRRDSFGSNNKDVISGRDNILRDSREEMSSSFTSRSSNGSGSNHDQNNYRNSKQQHQIEQQQQQQQTQHQSASSHHHHQQQPQQKPSKQHSSNSSSSSGNNQQQIQRSGGGGGSQSKSFLQGSFLPLFRSAYLTSSGNSGLGSGHLNELCSSLESCERSSPGITEALVKELLVALQPELGNGPGLRQAINNIKR